MTINKLIDPTRHSLKLLLLQIREAETVRREEHESFARYCKVRKDQIDILNVFDDPEFSLSCTDGYDALLVGGASDASVLEPDTYTFVPRSQQLMAKCVEEKTPVFASCFGFQLAALALGGRIVHDGENYEMGTIPVFTTEAAKTDPLFEGVEQPFFAVSVHKEKALNTPPGTVELAKTDACCHSFKVIDSPFWAFQFHPEVDRNTLVERLTFYKSRYTSGDSHLDAVLREAKETPFSNGLCERFIDFLLQN